ncbi:MAG: hypothetical protein M0Z27_12375 [Thermaerobacter sp.]|nr:hypothetical protein [Thermaerobacter sp.]MDA8146838.1 hypothetical protein [Thermaerobacter sp.]
MSSENPEPRLFAIVTTRPKGSIAGGGAPVFFVQNEEQREKLARYIVRITNANVHDLEDGTYIMVLNA